MRKECYQKINAKFITYLYFQFSAKKKTIWIIDTSCVFISFDKSKYM